MQEEAGGGEPRGVAERGRHQGTSRSARLPMAQEHDAEQRTRHRDGRMGGHDAADPEVRRQRGKPAGTPGLVGQVHAVQERSYAEEDRRPIPREHVCARRHQVGPPDQSQDPPPLRPDLDEAGRIAAAVEEKEGDEQHRARDAQPRLPAPRSVTRRGEPHEDDTDAHEDVPEVGRDDAARAGPLGVHHENAHDEQGDGAGEDVTPHPAGVAAAQAPAESERYREAGDEEERGKHHVGDRHPVDVVRLVQKERGRPAHAGHLVDEQHEQHVGATDEVDARFARKALHARHGPARRPCGPWAPSPRTRACGSGRAPSPRASRRRRPTDRECASRGAPASTAGRFRRSGARNE